MTEKPTVHVVDDDESARRSVCALVNSMGVHAAEYDSGEAFLDRFAPGGPGCLVTDVRMLGMSGLELQEELLRRDITLPVIVLTAYPKTSLAVRAMRSGAVTMLDKPYDSDELWDAIRRALALDAQKRTEHTHRRELRRRLADLTSSEREVLGWILQGKPNKAIAKYMDVSLRTVENRRQAVLQKMQATSVAELVRMVIEAGEDPTP
jgi:FixJ family two-component response regulator